jgi:ferritin-like metal-binding protein YciE
MKINTLRELYANQLQDLFSAESQILKALPKMIKKTASDELRSALEDHLRQTEDHVERLRKIFEMSEIKAKREKCKGMQGNLEEGDELLKELTEPSVRDAGIIAAAQRVEHYEIAGYGTARTFAEMLQQREAAELLQQTLDEEKQADERLSEVAVGVVNPRATEMDDESESRMGSRSQRTRGAMDDMDVEGQRGGRSSPGNGRNRQSFGRGPR